MQIDTTDIPGLVIVTPRRHGDQRGYFEETWNRRALAGHGIDIDFVQDNHSLSAERGTLRGLHYQAPPHAQAKLVRCIAGAIWDVAVDVRPGSATLGRWVGLELTPENGKQLLIPEGFLHGFVTLSPATEVAYKCSDYYSPGADGSVHWQSPALAIDWPMEGPPKLSDKDASAVDFADWTNPFDEAVE